MSEKASRLPSADHSGGEALGLAAGGELLGLAHSQGVDDVDLLLAGAVRDVGDLPAVGRPAGPLVVSSGGAGEVAGDPLLDRRVEEVAAGREDRALSLGREGDVLDLVGGRELGRPGVEAVAGDVDGEVTRLPGAGVEDVQLAVHLIGDLPLRVGAGPADVPLRALGELGCGTAGEVVGVEVERAGAVRGEVDLVADPHRIAFGARGVGDLLRRLGCEIEDPEILRPTSLVALPGAEVAGEGGVGDLLAVRREIGAAAPGHGERLAETAGDRHGVDAALAMIPAVAQGAEEDRLAVRRPAVDLIVVPPARRERPAGGVEGELLGNATGRRNDVDLLVAVVLAGEGDPLAVRRELGEHLEPGMGGQPARRPAGGRCGPQVTGIGEDDLVPVDIRKPQQLGLAGSHAGGETGRRGEAENESNDLDETMHETPP